VEFLAKEELRAGKERLLMGLSRLLAKDRLIKEALVVVWLL
jgi:hypothetical protein